MSKTALDVGLIAGAIAIGIFTYGAGDSMFVSLLAPAWASAANASLLFAVSVSAGLSGTFGLLQSILNPNDTSVPGSQQNSQNSAAYRRVVYGNAEVGGVLTYDSHPAGNNLGQDQGPQTDWRHQVYTLAGHQIASFGRGGIMCVVIDNIMTELIDAGNGLWIPKDPVNPWGGQIAGGGATPTLSSVHIAFEFDVGNPNEVLVEGGTVEGQPFPFLSSSCPDWTMSCCQVGRAKVHVAMRYDYYADGSQVGSHNLATTIPIYVNGSVPTFRFPCTGKPLLDPRKSASGGSTPTWQPDSLYAFANYVIDGNNCVEVQQNGPGGSFESGPGPNPPAFTALGAPQMPVADNQCSWLNFGLVKAGAWPGPNQTIAYPYTFKDPNGNLQTLNPNAGIGPTFTTGATEPAWATVAGQYTADGAELQQTDGVTGATITNPGAGYTNGSYSVTLTNGSGYSAIVQVLVEGGAVTSITVTSPGTNYFGGSFAMGPFFSQLAGSPTVAAQATAIVGPIADVSEFPTAWLCLSAATGYGYATNPSNPALIIYDYLLDTEYGMAADPATIDVDSIIAAANLCEETVVVVVASNGGSVSENLYSCNGMFDESTPRGDVLKALVASCAGTLVPPGDLWHLFAGAYSPPTANLTDDDLRDAIKFDFRRSRRDICNGVKGTFLPAFLPTNPTEAQPTAWRFTDFPPYQANGLQGHPNYLNTEDAGQIIWKDIKLGFCTSIFQAQRLAKIVLMLLRFQVSGVIPCKLTAFRVMAGDTITFTHKRWAAISPPPPTVFFVTQATIVIETKSGAPTMGVDLTLQQTDPSIYEFAAPTIAYSFPWQPGMGEYSGYETLGVL